MTLQREEERGGSGTELLNVCWWCDSISGNSLESEADFQRAFCHSEQYGTWLSRVISSGCPRGNQDHSRGSQYARPCDERKLGESVSVCNTFGVNIRQPLIAVSGIHLVRLSIAFKQIERETKWRWSESTQTALVFTTPNTSITHQLLVLSSCTAVITELWVQI